MVETPYIYNKTGKRVNCEVYRIDTLGAVVMELRGKRPSFEVREYDTKQQIGVQHETYSLIFKKLPSR